MPLLQLLPRQRLWTLALSAEQLRCVDANWRVTNYLAGSARSTSLLARPRCRPGTLSDACSDSGERRHGGAALVANTWLESTYSELHPDVSEDEAGLRKLFR
jgi:phosphoketolase